LGFWIVSRARKLMRRQKDSYHSSSCPGSCPFLEVEPNTNLNVSGGVGLAEDSSEVLQIKERRVWILETNPIHYVDGIDPDVQTSALTKPERSPLREAKSSP
jgi:hypothetical protein